jgi:O-acetyl-ADP-ribose deacetylase (regulator of RNase III)
MVCIRIGSSLRCYWGTIERYRHVIHTVGPRYSLKYQTAAENALHGCYR